MDRLSDRAARLWLIQCLRLQLPPGGVEVMCFCGNRRNAQYGAYFPFCVLWEFGAGSVLQNLLSILTAPATRPAACRERWPDSGRPSAAIGITRHRTPSSTEPAPDYQPGMFPWPLTGARGRRKVKIANRRGSAMKQWFRRRAAVAVFVFALTSMMALTTSSVAWAQPWCPVGWYWDNYMRSCQPVRAPTVTACVSATGRRGYVSAGVCIGN
jgi:hypothetical protein